LLLNSFSKQLNDIKKQVRILNTNPYLPYLTLGVKLFDRQANRIKLTPTGELAAKEAARLLQESAAMVTKVQNYDHSRRPHGHCY